MTRRGTARPGRARPMSIPVAASTLCVVLVLVPRGSPGAVGAALSRQSFRWLEVTGHVIRTTHSLPLVLRVPGSLRFVGETDFVEAYGGPAFDVSAAAFSSDSVLLAVHAETHADGSGGLDYSDLSPDPLAGLPFTSRLRCWDLRDETEEDIRGNHFLAFLRDRGFDLRSAILVKQYLATDDAGRAEVVLSYGRRLESCSDDAVARETSRVEREARAAFASLRKP